MNVLKTWFDNMYSENKNYHKSPSKKTKHPKLKEHLVVVISDFESFNMEALQDFILILR